MVKKRAVFASTNQPKVVVNRFDQLPTSSIPRTSPVRIMAAKAKPATREKRPTARAFSMVGKPRIPTSTAASPPIHTA